MNRRLEAGWKRITSGFLAFTIVSILILGNSGIAFAEEYGDRFYREETDLSELGEFSKAMRILADHHITVEYMYAFISRDKGKAFVIIRVDNDEKAMEALRDAGVVLLSAEEIHGM